MADRLTLGPLRLWWQHGRYTRISNEAQTVDRVDQTRMIQGRAKKDQAVSFGNKYG